MEVEIVEGEGAVLGVNMGHPVVTNGILCVRGGDAVLPKLLWDLLLTDVTCSSSWPYDKYFLLFPARRKPSDDMCAVASDHIYIHHQTSRISIR